MFHKKTLSHIFFPKMVVFVLTLYKNTQTRVSESGNVTVKYFTETA